ncbi:N-methyl-D-aspartate receptor NMDAR2C subunit [Candidatus Woesearchaeota archaeon]|nr:N-methyl-D-aspartate receptor NMDAR2C subunit [Candidatus Woesearchaeota archaeon]
MIWQQSGAQGDAEPVHRKIVTCYSESHRHYHTMMHIQHGLRELDTARHLTKNPLTVEWAFWFHDIIYLPGAATNEEQSAAYAWNVIRAAGLDKALHEVPSLILATKHHGVPDSIDAQVLVDIDLSILGQPEDVYAQYEDNIRKEYVGCLGLTNEQFERGRTAFVQSFLARPTIYATDFFRMKYESMARMNLSKKSFIQK